MYTLKCAIKVRIRKQIGRGGILAGQGSKSPNLGINKPSSNDKKKNALTKESEYGVQGIKAPLIEVAVKAEEIWGPALGGQEKEGSLKSIADSIESSEEVFRVYKSLQDCIKRRDYSGLVENYSKARKFKEGARQIAERVYRSEQQLTDQQVNQIVITGRVWSDVENRIEEFKRDVWRRLTYVQMSSQSSMSQSETEDYMPLINVLLELGVTDNPIWVWLLSRYDHLKNKINATFERSRVEIEVLRRRLAHAEPPSPPMVASHLKSAADKDLDTLSSKLDTSRVLELWDLIYSSLANLLSTKSGILGEVIEFWDKAQQFIEGRIQKTMPIGIDGQSQKHHRLLPDGTRDLHKGVLELIDMLQDYVHTFFVEAPINDVSMLYSPSPNTPTPTTKQTLSPFAHQDSRFVFDENNPPPTSLARGEAWEKFAFWPPYANSLSGVHYLEKIMTLVGLAAAEMAAMVTTAPRELNESISEKLRSTVTSARERSLQAICDQWPKDSEMFRYMEDWSRMVDTPELTYLTKFLISFENTLLLGLQKISYIPQAANAGGGSTAIITPPTEKSVKNISKTLQESLNLILASMMEVATSSNSMETSSITEDGVRMIANTSSVGRGVPVKTIRILLTLMNIKHLRLKKHLSNLRSQFGTHFSFPFENETPPLKKSLKEIEDSLFKSYVDPVVAKLDTLIHAGIVSETWLPTTSRPSEVRPYVYEALLVLVTVHSEVSATTNPFSKVWRKKTDQPPKPTAFEMLEYVLVKISNIFRSAFGQRETYPLNALMQATLDMEFVAQTMTQYLTDEAGTVQGEVYKDLDKKTTREVSQALQGELPGMRSALKKLRERTKGEFLCFKTPPLPKD
ncbi:uncharacterized protein KY384_007428 [Bacidia gigantensis]|uniref:uncharacterized protein n=1 Tax=Bacidia gigantensis TaxID=2732470 RepID=UPI001D04A754|nr:uncharacterized protein KY384_007428 [Bacidia gigantensis]KAG8528510.1 hypothetical protein KY384_007428 [Bacidia gigantensis]